MTIRGNRILQIYLDFNSKISAFLFGQKRAKKFYELIYWKLKKMMEGKLSNDHYEFFYTDFWGLPNSYFDNKSILDIGCGPRGSLEWAKGANERIGLDTLADQYLKMGADKHAMDYVNSGSENMPFENNHFDVVCSYNSIDHVEDVDLSIAEIKRVLKPGGVFLLIVEVHPFTTLTEPICLEWDFTKKFQPECTIEKEFHFEGDDFYTSVREGVPYNHDDTSKRYGIIAAQIKKL